MCTASGIQKTKEDSRATTMKEEIDWKKELLESGKFNNQFSKKILENGAKNYMQEIYMGYMYSRWRKIRDLLNNKYQNTDSCVKYQA